MRPFRLPSVTGDLYGLGLLVVIIVRFMPDNVKDSRAATDIYPFSRSVAAPLRSIALLFDVFVFSLQRFDFLVYVWI